MLTKVKVQAKTVSEAVSKALQELNMRRDQVEIKVLEQPKKGFLGFGSKPAVIEVSKKRWMSGDKLDRAIYMDVPRRSKKRRFNAKGQNRRGNFKRGRANFTKKYNQAPKARTPKANEPQLLPSEAIQNAVIPEKITAPMQQAQDYLQQVLNYMGVKTENLHTWWDEKQQRILITFDCDKPAIVIGKEGKTLEAIQYLSTLAITRKFNMSITVVADTQNYWRKTEDQIDKDIAKATDMLRAGVPSYRFKPMNSQLRRYIHRCVEGNKYITSASEGEGKWRKVVLHPAGRGNGNNTKTEQEAPLVLEETPTQKLASHTVAKTVASTTLETDGHTVTEHSVVVTTQETK